MTIFQQPFQLVPSGSPFIFVELCRVNFKVKTQQSVYLPYFLFSFIWIDSTFF